jgi:hypothetical protein
VLHSFAELGDGSQPSSGLIVVDGKFYGVTAVGGKRHLGAVYEAAPSGELKLIFEFGNASDGGGPGCKSGGVMCGNGTVYEITP